VLDNFKPVVVCGMVEATTKHEDIKARAARVPRRPGGGDLDATATPGVGAGCP